jgi:3-hydroxyacyl-CoA dehydrogenase
MVDTSAQQVEKGLNSIRSFLKGQVKKGKMEQEMVDKMLSIIKSGTDLHEAVSRADLVIEEA